MPGLLRQTFTFNRMAKCYGERFELPQSRHARHMLFWRTRHDSDV